MTETFEMSIVFTVMWHQPCNYPAAVKFTTSVDIQKHAVKNYSQSVTIAYDKSAVC